jgi:hypothetical protein
MFNPLDPSPPPTELAVIGEHKHDPERLLLLGADGHYYAYSLPDDTTAPIEPDDTWSIEAASPEDLFT